MAQRMSPLNYINERNLPPILTIHGEADTNTPVTQGIRLHEGLVLNDHRSELMLIPGGNHGLHNLTKEMEREIARRTFGFLIREKIIN